MFVLKKKEKKKRYHQNEIDKNVIQALEKLDASYNPAYLKYINDKFNDMTLEDTSEEKALIHQEHTYFSVLLS